MANCSMKKLREVIRNTPLLGPLALGLHKALKTRSFPGSAAYWEQRYQQGGDSGPGSYNRLAQFKAEWLNAFVARHGIERVIEWGCGDGHQLSLAQYPAYIGLDVSKTAVQLCMQRFEQDATKSFFYYHPFAFHDPLGIFRAELSLSLDVIYHLIEDEVFETYMRHLFASASRYVVIYSSDEDRRQDPHVRLRNFSSWVQAVLPHWQLLERVPNPYPFDASQPERTSKSDFFVYGRIGNGQE